MLAKQQYQEFLVGNQTLLLPLAVENSNQNQRQIAKNHFVYDENTNEIR